MSVEGNPTRPNFRELPEGELARRARELRRRYADCDLCAYDCGVDRTAGETGACRVDDTGLATGGLLVRHLVMPEGVDNAKGVLEFVADELSTETFVNVMAQYRPHYEAKTEERYSEIGRRITDAEYREVLDHARDVGLERLTYDPTRL